MSAQEIIAELPKLTRQELEMLDNRLRELLEPSKTASDETQIGLEDFPQFPDVHIKQEYLGRDVIYDARGR